MSWFEGARSRVQSVWSRRRAEERMNEEFRFHVDMEAERHVRAGLPEAEARRRAMVAFGGLERHREAMRDGRGTRWWDDLRMDLRYALRSVWRSPGFAAVAISTLALGIGANAAVFSVVDGILLRPLPFASPDRLVALPGVGYQGELLEMRERSRTLDIEAIGVGAEFTLAGAGDPLRLEGATVSAGAFELLGLAAARGRTFREGEDRVGAAPVVVLSHGLWQRVFGSDAGILDRHVLIDGVQRRVVGVMGAETLLPSRRTEIWVPIALDPGNPTTSWSRTAGTLVGRLRAGATIEQARTEIAALAPQMREFFPWNMPADYGRNATVVPLRELMVGDMRGPLLVLLAAVGLVLLIACVNVANLLLARTAYRTRETVVRAALGAGRGRLARQHLTESAVLGAAGALAGLAVAYAGVAILTSMLPADTPRIDEIAVDRRVLAFTAVMALGAAVAFGMMPALRLSALSLHPGLAQGDRVSVTSGRRRTPGGALVILEIALAVVLVVGAGLMLKGFWQLGQREPGFQARHLVSATIVPPDFRYPHRAARQALHARLLDRLGAIPGAGAVALADQIPFGGRAHGSVFVIAGRPHPARSGGDWPWADIRASVSDTYFRTMGVPLVRGRAFSAADREGSPRVAVVSRSLAARYWPDDDAIGHMLSFPGDTSAYTIVGVAEDTKWQKLTDGASASLYLPLRQASFPGPLSVLIRTNEAERIAPGLRRLVAELDDATPVSDVHTMDALVSRSVQQPRVHVLLLSVFAIVALALGAIGVYGTIAYAVSQRTREFGIRLALGAAPAAVVRQVVAEGMQRAAIGLAAGVIAALALTRVLTAQLYGVSALDPAVFSASVATLALVALLASWLPARRAARVDPATALRG